MSYLSSLKLQCEDFSADEIPEEDIIELSDGNFIDRNIIVEAVVTIVRDFGETGGLSIGHIRKYLLLSKFSDSMPNVEDIKMSLDNAVKKELLFKLPNEKYMITEAARRVLAETGNAFPELGQDENDLETEMTVDMSDLSIQECQNYDVSTALHVLFEKGFFIELSNGRIVNHKNIIEAIVKTVRDLGDIEGSSVSRIRQYLSRSNSMPNVDNMILCLDSAVEKGLLLKLPNGNYKISEAARWVLAENDKHIPETGRSLNLSYLSNLKYQNEESSTALQELVEEGCVIVLSDGTQIDHKIIVEAIVTAIRDLGESEGSSINRIRQYLLLSEFSNSMPNIEDTKLCLKSAVDEELLLKLPNKKYKITEAARRVLAETDRAFPELGQDENCLETEMTVDMSDLSILESQYQYVSTALQVLFERELFIELSDGRIVNHKIIVEAIVITVRDLGDIEGSSVSRIQQYLSRMKFWDSMPNVDDMILCLDNAVEKGLLLKLLNGNYKISEAARWVLEENDKYIPETGRAMNISYLSSLESQDEVFSTPLQKIVEEGNEIVLTDESLIDCKIIVEAIVTAIRDLGESEGSSINRIRQYLLLSKFSNRMPCIYDTKLCLKRAVDKELLLKLSNGKYKITDAARCILTLPYEEMLWETCDAEIE